MRMEVCLEAHGLWEVIIEVEKKLKKDQQAFSAILIAIP